MSNPSETENLAPSQKKDDVKDFFIQHRIILIAFGLGILTSLFLPGRMKLHVFSGILSGTLIGLVPYFVAKHYKQYRTSTIAMVACIFAGGAAGLFLVLPLTLVFLVIISLKANRSNTDPPTPGA